MRVQAGQFVAKVGDQPTSCLATCEVHLATCNDERWRERRGQKNTSLSLMAATVAQPGNPNLSEIIIR